MQIHVKILVVLFLVTAPGAFLFARNYTFDVFFFWMFGYAATAWIPIYPHEKKAFYARYRVWAAEIAERGPSS